jgi:hypothetical protein
MIMNQNISKHGTLPNRMSINSFPRYFKVCTNGNSWWWICCVVFRLLFLDLSLGGQNEHIYAIAATSLQLFAF